MQSVETEIRKRPPWARLLVLGDAKNRRVQPRWPEANREDIAALGLMLKGFGVFSAYLFLDHISSIAIAISAIIIIVTAMVKNLWCLRCSRLCGCQLEPIQPTVLITLGEDRALTMIKYIILYCLTHTLSTHTYTGRHNLFSCIYICRWIDTHTE